MKVVRNSKLFLTAIFVFCLFFSFSVFAADRMLIVPSLSNESSDFGKGNSAGEVLGETSKEVSGDVEKNESGDAVKSVTSNVSGEKVKEEVISGETSGEVNAIVSGDVSGEISGDISGEISNNVQSELELAKEKGLIPNALKQENLSRQITRTEFTAVCVNLYEKMAEKEAKPVKKNPFVDCSDEDVLKAYQLNITNGVSETSFLPNANITKEQAVTMLARTVSATGKKANIVDENTRYSDGEEVSNWAKDSITKLTLAGVVHDENGKFLPKNTMSREDAIVLALRTMKAFVK